MRGAFSQKGLPVGTRFPLIDRLLELTTEDELGCWIFHGSPSLEYGVICTGGRYGPLVGAHRASYEFFVSEIPDGLVLDHLCRVPRCVNPWHLEPVTYLVNQLRGEGVNATKTHCPAGHEYTPENTRYCKGRLHRKCRTCEKAQARARYERSKMKSKESAR